jgi:hypothetical protein
MSFVNNHKEPSESFYISKYVSLAGSCTRSNSCKLMHTCQATNTQKHFYFNCLIHLYNTLPIVDLNLSSDTIKQMVRNFFNGLPLYPTLSQAALAPFTFYAFVNVACPSLCHLTTVYYKLQFLLLVYFFFFSLSLFFNYQGGQTVIWSTLYSVSLPTHLSSFAFVSYLL